MNQLTGRWRSAHEDFEGHPSLITGLFLWVAGTVGVLTLFTYAGRAFFLVFVGTVVVSAGSVAFLYANRRAVAARRRVSGKLSWPRAVGETTVFAASPEENVPTTIVNGLACVVTFKSSSGDSICFDVSPVGHRTGGQVTVIYDAENPSDAYLLTENGR